MGKLLRLLAFISLLLFTSSYLCAQSRPLSGTVKHADTDEGLSSAAIRIKNTLIGVLSEKDGTFTIEANPSDTLVISYLGYITLEIPVGLQQVINVVLQPKLSGLDEVVVIGYGQKSRKNITGSIVTVDVEKLDKKPIARLENALQGQAAGVQVTQYSGRPGNALSVRIRGATSLSAGNEPLYVVDGVPVLSPEGINPADVASLQVLKDASASAIYGARAANGVVLITTKSGNAGAAKISFNAFAGINQINRKISLLGAADYVALINETYINAGQGPRLNAEDFDQDTDWQDEVYRNALNTNYQLSLSGGDKKSQYYVSVNHQGQEGIVKGSDFERTGVRLNYRAEVKKGIRWGSNLNIARITYNNVPDNSRTNQGGVILGALSAPPIIGIYNADGTYTVNPLQAWENPVANIEAPLDVTRTTRLVGALFLEWDVMADLTFKTSFNTETYYNKNDYFLDPFSTQLGRSLEGIGTTSTNQELIWLSENTLSYNKKLWEARF